MDSNTPAPFGQEPSEAAGGPVRPVELVAGDFLVTLNPVDGSGIEPCPPGRRSIVSRAAPADPPTVPPPPLLERDDVRAGLGRRLTRGRSVRVTGPRGAGRTALLDAVARDCAELAPDGVIRLSGHRRTVDDLQHELYAATHRGPAHRPGPTELRGALRTVGAVVVIDDVECDAAALGRLLDATPECAYLVAAAPGDADAEAATPFEEVALTGLSAAACRTLLERAVQRPLTDAETGWAGDLRGVHEGLPTRFLQAAALLHQRDAGHVGGLLPEPGAVTGTLTAALSDGAREVLCLAVALGGLVPTADQLPAVAGDPCAGAAREELTRAGLLTAADGAWRLAAGVAEELGRAGLNDPGTDRARTAVQHYTWWLTEAAPDDALVAAEAEVVLAAAQAAQRRGHHAAVASLGRAAAPRLAAALRWGAWERMLRAGQESARTAGFVDAQAYFHHELGVLAICGDRLDRASAELEASVGLRGVLADSGGVHAGRRALALVSDLSRPARTAAPPAAGDGPAAPAATRSGAPAPVPPGAGGPAESAAAGAGSGAPGPDRTAPAVPPGSEDATALLPATATAAEPVPEVAEPRGRWHRIALAGTRRNAAAAAAGTLVAAVLGTVVTLGLLSGENEPAGGEQVPTDDPATAPETTSPDAGAETSSPGTDQGTPEASPETDEPAAEPDQESEPTPSETSEAPATTAPPAEDDTGGDGGATETPSDPPAPTPTPSDPDPEPEPTESGPTDPEPSDPDPDPDPTEPDPTDPDPTDPEPTETSPQPPPSASGLPTNPESSAPAPDAGRAA